MSHNRKTWARRIVIGTAVFAAALPGAAYAANPAVPNLPVATEPCKVDTGPNWPSCGSDLRISGRPGTTAIIVGTGWACTGGGNEPVHCKPIFIGCTDDQEQCASTG